MKRETKLDIIEIIVGCFLMMTLGFCIHGLYDGYNNERILNGLYIYNSNNYSGTMEHASSRDSKGDWVCINVAYGMTPKEAYKTCTHECSHKAFSEIYAESCEDKPDKCLEWLNE